jgi:hypothetical protein
MSDLSDNADANAGDREKNGRSNRSETRLLTGAAVRYGEKISVFSVNIRKTP